MAAGTLVTAFQNSRIKAVSLPPLQFVASATAPVGSAASDTLTAAEAFSVLQEVAAACVAC